MVGFKRWWIQRGWQKWELLPSFNYCVKLNYLRNQKTWPLHHRFIHTSLMLDFCFFPQFDAFVQFFCSARSILTLFSITHFCWMVLFQQLLFCGVKTLFNGTAATLLNKQDYVRQIYTSEDIVSVIVSVVSRGYIYQITFF